MATTAGSVRMAPGWAKYSRYAATVGLFINTMAAGRCRPMPWAMSEAPPRPSTRTATNLYSEATSSLRPVHTSRV